jgi:membrane protein implicated in regulation of membrane protease activity
MKKHIVLRAIVVAIIYGIVILLMSKDYSTENLGKIGVQTLVFAVVFGLAIWLLEKWRGRKNKPE